MVIVINMNKLASQEKKYCPDVLQIAFLVSIQAYLGQVLLLFNFCAIKLAPWTPRPYSPDANISNRELY